MTIREHVIDHGHHYTLMSQSTECHVHSSDSVSKIDEISTQSLGYPAVVASVSE